MNQTSSLRGDGEGKLEVLWADGDRVFCRTWRGADEGTRTAVLAVVPASDHPTPSCLAHLAHEFALRNELDSGWAARPLEFVREHGRNMLVLEDSGSEPLIGRLGLPMEVESFLRLAGAIAAAITGLHARGLIHKNIKPANILVSPRSGGVRLTGFGIASRLRRERSAPEPPEIIAGTLAYMAPEQTGRMNRSVDARSDLYALGVTLYEMLIGTLPFTAADPMELVHCHLARRPVPPAERLSGLPAAVSDIVMKLLAKPPEERYQTAIGVATDLRRCLGEWESSGRIARFAPGAHDLPDVLRIPEKLYGREQEIDGLCAAFDRVAGRGTPELVLVSGSSGIGKSSVVNELHKALVPRRGWFASGKFDQYQRDIPYATLAQAFQSLIRQLLVKSEQDLAAWRDAIRAAVGANGRLIVDLVAELELLIGPQPPVAEDLSPREREPRFLGVLDNFLRVFARREHPLVLFLDDLQWADAATLNFLAHAVSSPNAGHLLAVGAYRDAEVEPAHPLTAIVDVLRKDGAAVSHIALGPLSGDDLCRMVAESLGCALPDAAPLAQLIHERTAGNPLFAVQFLSAMGEERLLAFDAARGGWRWNIDEIRGRGLTDNVVDLMLARLKRLPAATREVLEGLACLGNSADIATLVVTQGGTETTVNAAFWDAVCEGVVLRAGDSYRFLHDRVREAAYALIPDDRRAERHLQIGRLLLSHLPPEAVSERVFEIATQLNRGVTLISDAGESEKLRQLNALAGRKARRAVAYAAARRYLAQATALLPSDAWRTQYEDTFSLQLERCECEYLTGHPDIAAELAAVILAEARSAVDRAEVYRLRIRMSDFAGRSDDALTALRDALRLFGIELPESDESIVAAIETEERELANNLRGRGIAELADAPPATDPTVRMIIGLIVEAIAPIYATQRYFPLLAAKGVNLCLRHGNMVEASALYNGYALVLVGRGDFKSAFEFSDMSVRLVATFDNPGLQAILLLRHGFFVNHWRRHIATSLPYLHESYAGSAQLGNFLYAGYAALYLSEMTREKGDPLDTLVQTCRGFADVGTQSHNDAIRDTFRVQLQFAACLKGLTRAPTSFEDGQFSEADTLAGFAVWRFHVLKQTVLFLFGEYDAALESATRAAEALRGAVAMPLVAMSQFYRALSMTALYPRASAARRLEFRRSVEEALRRHRHWADNCPENFANRHALLAAEVAQIEGRDMEAMRLYEQAIRSAHAHGFTQNEALANELAGRFYLSRGLETNGYAHLRNARACYALWGADGKVRQLERVYPPLADPEDRLPTATLSAHVPQLDVTNVVKASQAVSGEILLPKLIETLMSIALQSAGADHGLLVLPQGDGESYVIEAEARVSRDTVELVPRQRSTAAPASPEMLLRYVIRTRKTLILDDASKPNLFSEDEYVRRLRPKSVLCFPLVRQGRLAGLLYLENTLTSHAFTADRIALLELLAAQAAISLENTRLYSEVQEREARIRRLVDANIVGICVWDFAGGTLEANDAFLAMVGYDREDLAAGRVRWLEMTPAEWRADTLEAMAQIKATGRCKPYEKEYFRKDGSRVPVLVGGAAFAGNPDQGLTFALDLTERKQAEAQLQQAGKMEAIGRLAGGIAHDFNNVLGVAINFARFLEEDLPPDSPQHNFARRIHSACVKGKDLVAQILAFARAQPPDRRSLDLRDVLRDARELLAGMLPATTRVSLSLAEEPLVVSGNESQLIQLVVNLCVNAQDALRGQAGDISIGAAALAPGDADGPQALLVGRVENGRRYVRIDVTDTGEGIPATALRRIFEPFFTTKERGRGTGLGLAVVHGIIAAHDGACSVASTSGRGTRFSVYLPLSETAAQASHPATAAGGAGRGGGRVLVVDDEVNITDALSIGLERLGYEVAAVNDPREALQAVRDDPAGWSVVVTDNLMPEMDGLALAEALRTLRPELPVILYTGVDDQAIEAAVQRQSFAAFVRKPAEAAALAQVIREVLPG